MTLPQLVKIFYPIILGGTAINGSSQVIPDSMRVDWSKVGYEGEIPDPTTIVDVVSFGVIPNDGLDDGMALVNTMNSLNGNLGVLYFPPGTYNFNSTISLADSVVLRGAGSDSTTLKFDFNGLGGDAIRVWKGQASSFVSVLSGYEKGSDKIVVSDASSFEPGDWAEINETNGAWDIVPASWAVDCVGQIIRISAISNDTLELGEKLRISYDASLMPRIRVFNPITTVGIECLKIVRADSTAPIVSYNLSYNGAADCWTSGVESDHAIGAHVLADLSTHLQITGCYFHHAYQYDGISTHGYGVTLIQHTGDCLIANNFFKHLRHAMMVKQGANGNVFAYNFSIEPTRTEWPYDASGDISVHGHYPFANLFEGNIVQTLYIDQAWGPAGPYNTYFRNREDLYGIFVTSGTVNTDRNNFVGNEITNTNAFYGFYNVTGSDHFLWGNNRQGTIDPAGTNVLNDSSYYLSIEPDFWYSWIPFPSVGIPNTISTGTIPARERYLTGGMLTQCGPSVITVSSFPDKEIDVSVNPNPFSEELTVSWSGILSSGQLEITLFDLQGRKVFEAQVLCSERSVPLYLSVSPELYILQVVNAEFKFRQKVIKE